MKVAWVLNSHFVFSSLSIDASKLVVNTNGTIVKIDASYNCITIWFSITLGRGRRECDVGQWGKFRVLDREWKS